MRILLILFSIIIASCSSYKKTQPKEEITIEQNKDLMSFFVFRIFTDSTENKNKIELINQIHSEGKFKKNDKDFLTYPYYLTIEILSQKNIIETITLEHPLYKNIEYIDEGQWQTKSFVVSEAEFFFRLQMDKNPTSIVIYETLKNKEKTALYTLKL